MTGARTFGRRRAATLLLAVAAAAAFAASQASAALYYQPFAARAALSYEPFAARTELSYQPFAASAAATAHKPPAKAPPTRTTTRKFHVSASGTYAIIVSLASLKTTETADVLSLIHI